MAWRLGPFASCASVTVVLDERPHAWPYVLSSNEFHRLVLAKVPRKQVIMLVPQNSQAQVGDVRNIYSIILMK
jgi:hypothetical protein